ncbi:hypothetical protein HJFPF1_13615 [Paramyrothecium foliicola]|nr:hypothetical protein HJFPF1_13615 [Paramyrothecium foliicola]
MDNVNIVLKLWAFLGLLGWKPNYETLIQKACGEERDLLNYLKQVLRTVETELKIPQSNDALLVRLGITQAQSPRPTTILLVPVPREDENESDVASLMAHLDDAMASFDKNEKLKLPLSAQRLDCAARIGWSIGNGQLHPGLIFKTKQLQNLHKKWMKGNGNIVVIGLDSLFDLRVVGRRSLGYFALDDLVFSHLGLLTGLLTDLHICRVLDQVIIGWHGYLHSCETVNRRMGPAHKVPYLGADQPRHGIRAGSSVTLPPKFSPFQTTYNRLLGKTTIIMAHTMHDYNPTVNDCATCSSLAFAPSGSVEASPDHGKGRNSNTHSDSREENGNGSLHQPGKAPDETSLCRSGKPHNIISIHVTELTTDMKIVLDGCPVAFDYGFQNSSLAMWEFMEWLHYLGLSYLEIQPILCRRFNSVPESLPDAHRKYVQSFTLEAIRICSCGTRWLSDFGVESCLSCHRCVCGYSSQSASAQGRHEQRCSWIDLSSVSIQNSVENCLKVLEKVFRIAEMKGAKGDTWNKIERDIMSICPYLVDMKFKESYMLWADRVVIDELNYHNYKTDFAPKNKFMCPCGYLWYTKHGIDLCQSCDSLTFPTYGTFEQIWAEKMTEAGVDMETIQVFYRYMFPQGTEWKAKGLTEVVKQYFIKMTS